MFGQLQKILDRNFIIGYFVPALVLVLGSLVLLWFFGINQTLVKVDGQEPLKDTALAGILSWTVALFYLVVNRQVYRWMEGYRFGLERYVRFPHGLLYESKQRESATLDKQFTVAEGMVEEDRVRAARNRFFGSFPRRYPSKKSQLLGTSFGNTVRAIEDYSRNVYGFESIQGWSRLFTVIPRDYREQMDGQEAFVMFWVNLWFTFVLLSALYLALLFVPLYFKSPWILVSLGISAFACLRMARSAAETWGEWVCGAFDVYLPALATKLKLNDCDTSNERGKMWSDLNQLMVFRDPEAASAIQDRTRNARTAIDATSPEVEDDRVQKCGE